MSVGKSTVRNHNKSLSKLLTTNVQDKIVLSLTSWFLPPPKEVMFLLVCVLLCKNNSKLLKEFWLKAFQRTWSNGAGFDIFTDDLRNASAEVLCWLHGGSASSACAHEVYGVTLGQVGPISEEFTCSTRMWVHRRCSTFLSLLKNMLFMLKGYAKMSLGVTLWVNGCPSVFEYRVYPASHRLR